MSTRAYKLIEIKTADACTFSVSGDWEFVQAYGRGWDDGDILQFDKADILKGIKEEKNPEWLAILKDIKKDIDEGEDYVEYYCY